LKKIRDWVTKLDKKEPVESDYEVVSLRYANPREVENSIGDGFRDLPGTEFLPSILVQPLEQTQQVIVFGRKDLREIVKKMIQEVDVPPGQFETAHIKLKHADPDTVKEKLDELYEQGATSGRSSSRYGFYGYNPYSRGRGGSSSQSSDMVKVISYTTLNEVTVIASPENMAEIRKRIAEWDVPLDVESLKPRIIELKNMDPVEMASLLTSLFSEGGGSSGGGRSLYNMLFGRGGADQEKIVGPLYGQLTFEEVPGTKKIIVVSKVAEAYGVIENLVKDLDREEMGEIPKVIELKYADPEDLSERLNALFVEPGQQARIQKTAQGLSDTSQMDDSTTSGSSSSNANQASQTDDYTPPWSGAGARSSMGANQQMPISNVIGRVRFIPEPHTKSMMVLAPPEFMDEIESLISALDVPGKQVVIEAIIVEVEHSKVTSLGVELSTNPNAFGTLGENAILALSNLTHFGTAGSASGQISPITGEFNTSGTSGTTLGIGTDVYGLIDFLIKTTDAKILNQQTLWTKDNEEANFFKGSQVAFSAGTTQGANIGVTQNITFEKVGMELRARPSITPEDNVDMIVNVQISQLTTEREQGQPIRSLMNTTTNMIVKDGQTLLLGGILFQKDSKVEHKLPVLGDAPLVGGLFRHNAVNQTNSEMLVFMTPRVIEEPNAAIPEAIGPKEKLDTIRKQLGTNLQDLSSKEEEKEKKSTEVVNQDQKQDKTGELTARSLNEDEAGKSKALRDPSNEKKDIRATRQVKADKNPNVYSFTAMRPQINPGQSSTLSWSISNADSVRIEPGIGIVGTLGSRVVTPTKTTTYTLIAQNETGESRVTKQIEVRDRSESELRATAALDDRKEPGD
jgi:general secretion pathway protein D